MQSFENEIQSSDCIVFQHNNITQARYSLTLQEKRVVLWLSSQVKPSDKDFHEHTVSIKEFCVIAGLKSKNMYKEIEKTTESLMGKVLKIRSLEDNTLEQLSWLSYAKYIYDDGVIILRFDPALKKYLLELKDCFTQFSLEQALSFKSIYSVRMYEMFSQFISLGTVTFSLRELRERFDLKQEEYSSYKDLKRRMIERACSEINSKSTMQVRFIEIKVGRHVGFVQFFIEDSRNSKDVNVTLFEDGQQLGLSVEAMNRLMTEFPENLIQKGLLVLKNSKKEVKNPLLFVRKAIKEEWQPFFKAGELVSGTEHHISIQTEISLLKEPTVCIRIRMRFLELEGISAYKSWIRPLLFFVEGETIVALVKTKFIKDWLETNYARLFRDCADGMNVVFRLENEDKQEVVQEVRQSLKNKEAKRSEPKGTVKKINKKTKTKQEAPVKKKTLWQKIKSFWK